MDSTLSRPKMSRNPTDNQDSDDDSALFREMVGDVKPIEQNQADSKAEPPKARPRQREADERQVLQDMLSDHFDDSLETGEELSFLRAGQQKRILKKMRRGQYAMEAELDLHGYRSEEARPALVEFLDRSRSNGRRCVRIVHGRALHRESGPVLKPLVNSWLRQRGDVLAFCSAPPSDGGAGAVYVLLKSAN